MPDATCGTTHFQYNDDWSGKVKIATAEGSTVAIPAEDLLKFVAAAYVRPMRAAVMEKMNWRDVLTGDRTP